jgi:hypothetical protein
VRARLRGIVVRYEAFVMPRADGLPPLRLLLALPAVLLVVGMVLVGLGLSGSSSGAFFDDLSDGRDPALLAGEPRDIRSDEWNVVTVWTIAQVEQGLPAHNATFPGGMDAAVPYDLPTSEWSMAFRPHLLGYLVLDVDHATAWRWWSMGLALASAAYVFALIAMPRRPVLSTVLAVGFVLSPFFQWWYQAITFWPVVWGLVVMAALLWASKSGSTRSRWAWAAVVAYATVVMAMGIYVPFIVPVVIVVLFFALGLTSEQRAAGRLLGAIVARFSGVLAAGAVGAVVTMLWLSSRIATVDGLFGTVYPGERTTPAGSGGVVSIARAVASSFAESLHRADGFMGLNSSEASTFQLTGLFLVPVAGWLVVRAVRSRTSPPWVVVALVAVLALFAAYSLIPGWDAAARLLLLDRSTAERVKIGVGLASFVLLVQLVRELDGIRGGAPRPLAAASTLVFALSQVGIAAAVVVVLGDDRLWSSAPLWWALAALSAAAVYAFARRRVAVGAGAVLIVALVSGVGVNPLYSGVLDLRETSASRAVVATDRDRAGTWLAVGSPLAAATLVESGVRAYNGTQGAPPRRMWQQIDPAGAYAAQWNRLGGVNWIAGAGEPVVTNPALDQISVTFDACSDFAQAHVDYVLADAALARECLTPVSSHRTPHAPLTLYRVDPR